jgi:hypothetical protein
LQSKLISFYQMLNGHFRLIARRPGPLKFLVAADSRHGSVGPNELSLCAKIATAQRKLNQFAHLNRVDWL